MGWLNRKSRARDSERGQASVMIGIMLLTLLLFFTFVVDTGMLVNAKINLQNAADLAAYAGASVQARQLNEISYLNYEMRRQYKKFLFRYYVVGNMAQKSLFTAGDQGERIWSPDGDPINNYEVPAVCIIFSGKDNYCQNPRVVKITIPPPTFNDPINQTLIQQLVNLEQIKERNCGQIGDTNVQLLMWWLYNVDPEFQSLQITGKLPEESRQLLNVIQGTASGIGLIPRELILRQRIQTLAGYLNAAAEQGLTFEKAQAFTGAQDQMSKERASLAFLSAYYTLGEHTFDGQNIVMDEILPKGQDGSGLINLQDVKEDFDTYAITFEKEGLTPTNTTVPQGSDCVAKTTPITVHAVPVGVAKDPKTLTYYAVRVKATAKVLFWPFGSDPVLKAYSAAQPFGSRIGPSLDDAEPMFIRQAQAPSQFLPQGVGGLGGSLVGKIPDLPVSKSTGGGGQTETWNSNNVIQNMYRKLSSSSGGTTAALLPQVVGPDELNRAYQAAMVPNPPEGTIYNILSNAPDPFNRPFDSSGHTAFWAPVLPPDKIAQATETLKNELDELFNVDQILSPSANPNKFTQNPNQPFDNTQIKNAILTELVNYVDRLTRGQGEKDPFDTTTTGGEGMNIARLQDPFPNEATGGVAGLGGATGQPISLPSDIMMDPLNIKDYKTSWNKVHDSNFRSQGRVGYSVKFVSFDSLTQHRLSATGGGEAWNNTLSMDGEAEQDIPFLKH